MRNMLLIACLFLSCWADAQSVGPATLNASGNAATISGNTYEWSVAEMAAVSTYASPTLVLTQGVLQPSASTSAIRDIQQGSDDIIVFPNPVIRELYLQCSFTSGGKLSYTISDITGKTILKDQQQLANGKEKLIIDLKAIAAGNYVILLTYDQPSGNSSVIYKITKTQ